jgi:hypothetical protein
MHCVAAWKQRKAGPRHVPALHSAWEVHTVLVFGEVKVQQKKVETLDLLHGVA